MLAYSHARRMISWFCTQWPSSVIATTPRAFERTDRGELLRRARFFVMAAGHEDVHDALPGGAFVNQRDGAGAVDRR